MKCGYFFICFGTREKNVIKKSTEKKSKDKPNSKKNAQ